MSDDLETIAERLDASPDYRVLRRLNPRPHYAVATPGADVRRALVLDVETTGLSLGVDRIIELGLVAFTYDARTGQPLDVVTSESWLEDPGRPIPPEIVALTGITDDDVRGKRIDDERVQELAREAVLVVAHNASFDRPFVERRLPAFADRFWGCSIRDIGWDAFGFGSGKLEHLLTAHTRTFLDTHHRALDDCRATLHVLATPLVDGRLPFQLLVDSCRVRRARVCAIGSPFDSKLALKARGYHWTGDEGKPSRTWCREVKQDDVEAEVAWLQASVYAKGNGKPTVDRIDQKRRYAC